MQKFLDRLVEKMLNEQAGKLEDIALILPSKRAGTFLLESLSKQSKTSTFTPQIFSLSDFVESQSDLVVVESTELLIELYEVHQQLEGEAADSFELFMSWGSTLLQDFNEIDRYLIDGNELFTFLTEAKALEQWNLNGEALTDFQQKYLKFWRKLSDYYREFKIKLAEQGKAYSGMQFRALAEQFLEKPNFQLHADCVYVAGFNAFSEAEKSILGSLEKFVKVEYLWDSDSYYMNDNTQEAGIFLRKEKAKRNDFSWVTSDLLEGTKEIKVYGVSANVGQAKTVASILADFNEVNGFNDTALVLADEGLLMPVLESLPENVGELNVTMGAAINQSYLYDFFESFLQLLLAAEKEADEKGNFSSIYHAPLQKFLQHPLQKALPKNYQVAQAELLERIKKENLLWVPKDAILKLNEKLDFSLFIQALSPQAILEALLKMVHYFMQAFHQNNEKLELEYLAHFEVQFQRLLSLQTERHSLKSVKDLYLLYRQMIADAEVSFVGEPLKGLQIMGVLESRLLDFKNVILCSLNEGLLPAGKKQNSFIPFDIKHKYNLPSYKEKDAIYAYHFYRLLQRSENIHLIYNTKLDQLYGGERSRFLEQLIYELARKNPKVSLQEFRVESPLIREEEQTHTVLKTQASLQHIKKHWQSGLSASALNTYLNCSLDYYYRYVLGLKGEEALEEEIEASTFGSVMHDTLEELYQKHIDQVLSANCLTAIKDRCEAVLEEQYFKHMQIKPHFGAHRLAFEAAKLYLHNVIAIDEKEVQKGSKLVIRALEKEFKREYELGLEDLEIINLKGKIDRIDELNGQTRIIDYKSGKVAPSDLKTSNIETLLIGNKPKMAQLLFYLSGLNLSDQGAKAGIISMKSSSNGFMPLVLEEKETTFLNMLQKVALEILNVEVPFSHNEKSNYCDFC